MQKQTQTTLTVLGGAIAVAALGLLVQRYSDKQLHAGATTVGAAAGAAAAHGLREYAGFKPVGAAWMLAAGAVLGATMGDQVAVWSAASRPPAQVSLFPESLLSRF